MEADDGGAGGAGTRDGGREVESAFGIHNLLQTSCDGQAGGRSTGRARRSWVSSVGGGRGSILTEGYTDGAAAGRGRRTGKRGGRKEGRKDGWRMHGSGGCVVGEEGTRHNGLYSDQ